MKVWVGHYRGNPKQWFVVWAKSIDDAYEEIDNIGEPDTDSLTEIRDAGLVNFAVKSEGDKSMDFMKLIPPREDIKSGYWLWFGEASEDVRPYIYETAKKRRGPPND